jgi:hypothetical protein
LSQPLSEVDDVSADYKTQAGALLAGDPVDMSGQHAAEYFRNYYEAGKVKWTRASPRTPVF